MKKKHAATMTNRNRNPGRIAAVRRAMTVSVISVALPMLLISACTTYRPLGQGASVPWAKALSADKGGAIDRDRYRVAEGDALSSIAERYGVRLTTLAAVNNIEAPYVLYPGEVLRIPPDAPLPVDRPALKPGPTIAQTELPPVQHREQEQPDPETIEQPAAEPDGKHYVVASGESLSVIAYRHGMRLAELVAANDIEAPYQVSPGQTLIIPLTEAERGRQVAVNVDPSDQEPVAAPPPLSGEGFLWPVDGRLISTFEQNADKGRSGGVSIAARKGTPVRAADNGIVAYAGEALSGYGQMLMLRHADGYVTLYAHNDTLLVHEGDVVHRGQTIAEVGNSGDVVDSQLHFELRKGTKPIDPTDVLAGLPGRRVGQL